MEVLTTAEMERADRLTIAGGTPGFALMLSAGQAVAEAAMDLVEEGPILVVAGRGNNGGGGFVGGGGKAGPARGGFGPPLLGRARPRGEAPRPAKRGEKSVRRLTPPAGAAPGAV